MIYFLSILFSVSLGWAEVKLPALTSPVVDEVGVLSSQEQKALENWIRQYRQQGKAQLQVAIVPDLQGLPVEEYSIKLVQAWKLGGAKTDDGVLFLVAINDKKMRIEVGQGLEGALTDVQSKRILDDQVRPLFRSRQFAAGIATGIAEIIKAVDPEYAQGHIQNEETWHQSESGSNKIFLYIFLIILFMSLFGRRRRRSGILPFLGGYGMGGGFGRGGWGGGGGGGWSGGGGGFSGGGASSDW